MKMYHYEVVARYLSILKRHRLSLIVGLQGAFGNKEYYTKESVNVLVACSAR